MPRMASISVKVKESKDGGAPRFVPNLVKTNVRKGSLPAKTVVRLECSDGGNQSKGGCQARLNTTDW